MATDEPSSIQTRPSLLNRLKTGDNAQSWEEFYRVYGRLVRDFAVQAGLNDTEADEVVQETAIAMTRHLPEYRYNPQVCRFKSWLLNQASWRIKDQLKKRKPELFQACGHSSAAPGEDTARTSTINRVPDPGAADLDTLFETEWRKNLFAVALDRVKKQVALKQFQLFDLYMLKERSAVEVARALGVTVAQVYLAKHRVSALLKKELSRLQDKFE